jgi:MFS family permease
VITPNTDAQAAGESAEAAFDRQVQENFRSNYLKYLFHGVLGQTGMRLINTPTFIPAYVHLLSGSDFVVGLARSLQYFGMFATPLLSASILESRKRALPVAIFVGMGMRVPILGIALAGFFLPGAWKLIAVCAFLAIFGAFLGMQSVAFSFLLSKLIPVERRGVLIWLRVFVGGLLSAGIAGVGGWFVAQETFGDGYATTFGLAFVLTSLGLLILSRIREPDSPTVREREALRERLRALPALLRSDVAFTRYFIARALATMGRMALPFYALSAKASIGLSGETLGVLSTAFLLAQTGTNLGWGWIADRRGFRLVFIASLGVWMAATSVLFVSSDLFDYTVVFAVLGIGFGGFQMSAQNLVLEFGERDDLPLRIAVANSASELVGAVGPLLAGAIAVFASYEAVFATSLVFQLAAIAIVVLWVEEPRHRLGS